MHNVELPDHILERARHLRGTDGAIFSKITPSKTAHVVVDLQNGFMVPGAPVEVPMAREIVGNVNQISAALRAAGGTVVYLRYTADPDEPMDWSAWYQGVLSPEVAKGQIVAFAPGA
ncbi:MAG: isochorismatase family protein, partial [Pseudomonadota bacterium]